MKKAWNIPSLEVLNVSETELGVGRTYLDWSKDGTDFDLNDSYYGQEPDNS